MEPQRSFCLFCGEELSQPTRGRHRLFCNGRCKQAYHRGVSKQTFEEEREAYFLIEDHSQKYWMPTYHPRTVELLLSLAHTYGLSAAHTAALAIGREVDARKLSRDHKAYLPSQDNRRESGLPDQLEK